MTLNHLNLTVTDPVATQEFLTKYFGMKLRAKGNQNKIQGRLSERIEGRF
jgi:hypothetical protein